MLKSASRVLCAAITGALMLTAPCAEAAVISGVYVTREGGQPLADHQLHFENRISGDIFLARTGADGSFTSDLPPGTYDLRAERGLVVKAKIVVGDSELNVGRVADGAPFDLRRPFEREGIGPTILDTEAPATAHVEKGAAPMPSSMASPAQSAGSVPTVAPSQTQ
jgi:hypothetical protein